MENKRRSERAKEAWVRLKASGKPLKKSKPPYCIYGRTKSGEIDWDWRTFVVRLRDLYRCACEMLGYSKCDSRHVKLANHYGLLWWPDYAKHGGTIGKPKPLTPDYYLRWFRSEDEFDVPYDRPAFDAPWRRDAEAGRLPQFPKPISCFRPINTPGENHVGPNATDAEPGRANDPREADVE
jgi:hypothetical protein